MKYLKNHPDKFRKKSDVPNCMSPKTKGAKSRHCCNDDHDLYIEIESHKDILNQNPVVMIARIFNALPVNVKMIECILLPVLYFLCTNLVHMHNNNNRIIVKLRGEHIDELKRISYLFGKR
jgi:hypothetical protein